MQCEQWMKAIICVVSDEYTLSDEKAKSIFKRVLIRMKMVLKN